MFDERQYGEALDQYESHKISHKNVIYNITKMSLDVFWIWPFLHQIIQNFQFKLVPE